MENNSIEDDPKEMLIGLLFIIFFAILVIVNIILEWKIKISGKNTDLKKSEQNTQVKLNEI